LWSAGREPGALHFRPWPPSADLPRVAIPRRCLLLLVLALALAGALAVPAGAVLLTGTGIVPDPPFTLEAGDDVRIAIEGLGVLRNPVVRVGASA